MSNGHTKEHRAKTTFGVSLINPISDDGQDGFFMHGQFCKLAFPIVTALKLKLYFGCIDDGLLVHSKRRQTRKMTVFNELGDAYLISHPSKKLIL